MQSSSHERVGFAGSTLNTLIGNSLGVNFEDVSCPDGYTLDILTGVYCNKNCAPGTVNYSFSCSNTCNQIGLETIYPPGDIVTNVSSKPTVVRYDSGSSQYDCPVWSAPKSIKVSEVYAYPTNASNFYVSTQPQSLSSVLNGTIEITETKGQFKSSLDSTFVVNSRIKVEGNLLGSGTIADYSDPSFYYIVQSSSTKLFSLAISYGGSPINTTSGSLTGLTFTALSQVDPPTTATNNDYWNFLYKASDSNFYSESQTIDANNTQVTGLRAPGVGTSITLLLRFATSTAYTRNSLLTGTLTSTANSSLVNQFTAIVLDSNVSPSVQSDMTTAGTSPVGTIGYVYIKILTVLNKAYDTARWSFSSQTHSTGNPSIIEWDYQKGQMTGNFNFLQKDDWVDDKLVCRKKMYDRGVGLIPDECDPNTGREYFAKMCYTKCDSGKVATSWSPCTCSQPCPPNTTEAGFANCTKGAPYGRGAGNWGNGCPGGYDNFGLWCFRWKDFSFSGYNCPGNCNFVPLDANYGRNTPGVCAGGKATNLKPVATNFYDESGPNATKNGKQCNLGQTDDDLVDPCTLKAFTQKPTYDGRGRLYSQEGCYPNQFNPGAYSDSLAPSYYLNGKFPAWSANQGSIPKPSAADTYFNTIRSPQQSNDCEENWGTLCYPKCDMGFKPAGCCICSPDCGALRDDGATCHRDNYDRGVGKMPNACSDDNRIFSEELCYKACDANYINFCTSCTRRSCPYASKTGFGMETALVCNKDITIRFEGIPAIPSAADLISGLFDIGGLASGLQKILLNSGVIILILFSCSFILMSKTLLTSNKIKFSKTFKPAKALSGAFTTRILT